jgi:chemotaxis protein methyltransferase CheR/two-component system CheB/CheR fusion protein
MFALPASTTPGARATALHVAGVGASAGGLEAMLPMFARMQPTGRIAYVVAQHMAKDGHDELVVRLIGRESALPVVLADDGAALAADTVYVIPSGRDGQVEGTTVRLAAPLPGSLSTPSVNVLFDSIAQSQRSKAIGIVLSGTGSDGVAGCRAIRAAGGVTLAQDPQEAKFDGMPQAAITARQIDEIIPVGHIGPWLAARFPGAAVSPPVAAAAPSVPVSAPPAVAPERSELDLLLRQVHEATGIDFSSYKEDTLLRRLEKRKATLGVDSAAAYQALIRRQPEELDVLQHLFLVSVSSFFRDRDSFAVLEKHLAAALAGKPAHEPFRLWVPGCASGEEALTLAILLREADRQRPLEITATDLNPEALALARAGLYRQTAFKEMDAALRERYFTPKGQHYQVEEGLLACIRYEERDVLAGPPAGTHDLVSCRNLLIYMKSPLQDQLVKSFHSALRSQGLLFIGQSESLSFIGNSLFAPIDHYHRLFRKRH